MVIRNSISNVELGGCYCFYEPKLERNRPKF